MVGNEFDLDYYDEFISRHDLHNGCSMADCVDCVKESGTLESWQELFPQAYHDRYDNAAYMAAYRALVDYDGMSEDEARHHMVMAQDEVIAILQGKSRSFFLFNDAAENWILSMVDAD